MIFELSETHARRKFSEIVKISDDPQGIAAQMLERLKPLYALEARVREKKLDFRIRKKRLRQKIAYPFTREINQWLRIIRPTVPPKSQLGQAISYTLKQWKYVKVHEVRHGALDLTDLLPHMIDPTVLQQFIDEQIALAKKMWDTS